ncbi:hypothetical protein EYF80_045240 [Liparis tanakae]|uniref:Uncharacterized protein n=1 Tax=Liparis tanakae TaxID=230148 RepID=A0A4Z2FTL4_9TELE|nr:hypothetical protein EYF80_045240 [Liparis tanakae]
MEERRPRQDHGELTGVVGVVQPGLVVHVPRVVAPGETHDAISGLTPHSARHAERQHHHGELFSGHISSESRLELLPRASRTSTNRPKTSTRAKEFGFGRQHRVQRSVGVRSRHLPRFVGNLVGGLFFDGCGRNLDAGPDAGQEGVENILRGGEVGLPQKAALAPHGQHVVVRQAAQQEVQLRDARLWDDDGRFTPADKLVIW